MYKKVSKGQQIVFKPRRMVIGGVVHNVESQETLDKIKLEMTLKKEEQLKIEEEEKNKKILIKRTVSNNKNDVITKILVDPDTILTKEEKLHRENKNNRYADHIKKPALSVKSNSAGNSNNISNVNDGPMTIKTHAQKFIKRPTGKIILNPVNDEDVNKDTNEEIFVNNDIQKNDDNNKPVIVKTNEKRLIVKPNNRANKSIVNFQSQIDDTTDNYFTKNYQVLGDQWYELVVKIKHNINNSSVKLLIKILDENKNQIIHPIKISNDMFLNNKYPNNLYDYKIYVYIPEHVAIVDVYIVGLKLHSINLNPIDKHIVEQGIDMWKFRKLNDLEFINYYIKNTNIECSEKFIDRFKAEYELYKNPTYFENFINTLNIDKVANNTFEETDKTKVLYLIHSSIEYEEYSYTVRTQQLLENFNKNNSNYEIICAIRYGYPFDREVGYYTKDPLKETVNNNVKYIKLISDKSLNFNTLNILKYLEKNIIEVINLCINENIKIIHATTNYWNGIVASCVCKYLNIKCIYELRELWNESIMLQKPEVLHSDIVKMISIQEKYILSNVDKVLILNDTQNNMYNSNVDVLYDATYINDKSNDIIKNKLLTKHNLHNKIVIGFVGSLTAHQNIEHIFKSIKIINDDKLMFVIIGDGSHKNSLLDYVKTNGLNDNVLYLGKLKYNEAIKYYQIFDMCIFPRKNCELYNFKSCYKIIESMSNGVPVITSNMKATSEYITDGETGLLYEPDDINSLVDKVKALIDNTDLRKLLSKNALEFITKNNRDLNGVCIKLGNIYDELIKDEFVNKGENGDKITDEINNVINKCEVYSDTSSEIFTVDEKL
jgi:glycosyltransferase involved in cell wall biosynthesis